MAGPSVACRAQKCTVPVALTPNVLADVDEPVDVPDELQAPRASAAASAAAAITE
jgi:hypothetical protein